MTSITKEPASIQFPVLPSALLEKAGLRLTPRKSYGKGTASCNPLADFYRPVFDGPQVVTIPKSPPAKDLNTEADE